MSMARGGGGRPGAGEGEGEGGGSSNKRGLDKKMLAAAYCASLNVGRGWNFMWGGQAGLGHPPWEGGWAVATRGGVSKKF